MRQLSSRITAIFFKNGTLTLQIEQNKFKSPFQSGTLSAPIKFQFNNKIFTLSSNLTSETVVPLPTTTTSSPQDYYDQTWKNKLDTTDIGFRDKSDYYTIHIFFDQFGNSLFGSLPTGVQRKYHYVAHVLYMQSDPNIAGYRFNVTSGTLSDNLSIYNINTPIPKIQGGTANNNSIIDVSYNMFPTSDDLSFELDVIKKDDKTGNFVTTKIQSYTIKKTPYYIGAFNIGVFNTWLANPSYQLVNLPGRASNSTDQTVKVTDNGPSINATFMYTVYLSIYNLFYPYSKSKNQGYKYNWWGRTYLDDKGNFLRKIYPCFGVGLNGTVLNNWYAGFNLEPMQGFGIFVGQNIRKVNTFDMHFTDTTAVSQDQFNFYQNTKWKSGWAVGVVIDMSIFSKIAGSITSSSTGK